MMQTSVVMALAVLLSAGAAAGQARTERFDAQPRASVHAPPGFGGEWRALRIAKWGTLAGGIVLGVSQGIGRQIDPQWGELAGHFVFLAVLVFRPTGLFGKAGDR